jgi:hypothetical protein
MMLRAFTRLALWAFTGKTMCVSGLVPLSPLETGTPEKVEAYAKKLTDVVKR